MKLLFVHDHRFKKVGEKIYSNGGLGDAALKRYTDVFGAVTVAARIEDEEYANNYSEITLENVTIKDVYNNNNLLKEEIMLAECVIVRIPSLLGIKALKYIKKYDKPYLIELVGCPWDAYWNHSFFGKCLMPLVWYATKKSVKNASWVVYVSDFFLEKRYPTKGKWTNCSNVSLSGIEEKTICDRIKKIEQKPDMLILGTVGAINVKYKGQQYVIKAVSKLKKEGYKIKYQIVGGGDDSYLLKQIQKYGVDKEVEIVGTLPHNKIFDFLDSIDLYIHPSLTEGLPRAVIEAMSRGCPALGSDAGGIPELLNSKYVFKRGNVNDISAKIKLMANSKEMISEAKRSFERAKDFIPEKLERRRKDFFELFKKESVKEND